MGIFDRPTKSVAKVVPVSMQPVLGTIRAFAEDSIPDALGYSKKEILVAMVMVAWVNAHARVGTFDIKPRDLTYVLNLYGNWARSLGDANDLLPPILLALLEAGMLPEYMRSMFEPDKTA